MTSCSRSASIRTAINRFDFNSKQGLKLLSEYANVGTAVANKEMIFFEDDRTRLLRRRDAILRSLEAIQD
jgi:hypothetical protein